MITTYEEFAKVGVFKASSGITLLDKKMHEIADILVNAYMEYPNLPPCSKDELLQMWWDLDTGIDVAWMTQIYAAHKMKKENPNKVYPMRVDVKLSFDELLSIGLFPTDTDISLLHQNRSYMCSILEVASNKFPNLSKSTKDKFWKLWNSKDESIDTWWRITVYAEVMTHGWKRKR